MKTNLRSGVLFSEERESIAKREWRSTLALLYFRVPPKKKGTPDRRLSENEKSEPRKNCAQFSRGANAFFFRSLDKQNWERGTGLFK